MNRKPLAAFVALILAALLGLITVPAAAAAQQVDAIDEVSIAPLPITSVHLVGDVYANGHAIGMVDFAFIFSEDDLTRGQLWAVLEGTPAPICYGRIFETPDGEPIFHGSTSLMEPAGTCFMSQLPDKSAIALFAAGNDGQWASSILRSPDRVSPVPIFE